MLPVHFVLDPVTSYCTENRYCTICSCEYVHVVMSGAIHINIWLHIYKHKLLEASRVNNWYSRYWAPLMYVWKSLPSFTAFWPAMREQLVKLKYHMNITQLTCSVEHPDFVCLSILSVLIMKETNRPKKPGSSIPEHLRIKCLEKARPFCYITIIGHAVRLFIKGKFAQWPKAMYNPTIMDYCIEWQY